MDTTSNGDWLPESHLVEILATDKSKYGVEILKYFKYSNLPERLRYISKLFCETAVLIYNKVPEGDERTMAWRKLLEAKNYTIKAAV